MNKRSVRGTTIALRLWLQASVPTPVGLRKPCRVYNQDISRANRGEAARGRAAGRGEAG